MTQTAFAASRPFGTTGGANSVCIAWIDESSLTRECLTQALAIAEKLFLLIPFVSVYECIKAAGADIDLIVYHAHESDTVNIVDIIALREAFASTRLVVLSDACSLNPTLVKEVLKVASALMSASQTGLQMMVSALALVTSGGTFMSRDLLLLEDAKQPATIHPREEPGLLTEREQDVLKLLKRGEPNKLIAYALELSESTVKVHIRNIMRKTGAINRTHAAMNADKYLGAMAA